MGAPKNFVIVLIKKKLTQVFSCEHCEVFNAFTPNHVYLRSNKERLLVPLQMQLSEKPKTFCCFLLHFWNLPTLNLQHFHIETVL